MMRLNPSPSALAQDDFLAIYGGVYESSRWVAQAVWPQARAGDLDALEAMQAAMRGAVERAGREKQMMLVRAHPELASRAAIAGEMTAESKAEQKGAGLDQCSQEEFAEFMTLNQRYNERFGFPFIIAVKGLDRQAVLRAFRQRIGNGPETEFAAALEQIHRIAAIRLAAMISKTR
jgi:OHCU decarboxylase